MPTPLLLEACMRRTIKAPATPFWQDNGDWFCPAHLQRLPAAAERCWAQGCLSKRPAGSAQPPARPPEPRAALPVAPHTVESPKAVEAPQAPPETGIRRGKHQVACAQCGVALFRKPSEIKNSSVFFCSRAHQTDHRIQQELERKLKC